MVLHDLVGQECRELRWGFNEWLNAQTGRPSGRDWQTWSASMYLYAVVCVERKTTPFFDWIRSDVGFSPRDHGLSPRI